MSSRILIAEDEADIRRLISYTLRRRGYTVLETGTGDEALALTRQERPHLAILDVMLPGLSGIDVTQMLTSDPTTHAIPVMLLSARGQLTEIAEGLASGARAYVVKPFSPRELTERIAELLEPAAVPAGVARGTGD